MKFITGDRVDDSDINWDVEAWGTVVKIVGETLDGSCSSDEDIVDIVCGDGGEVMINGVEIEGVLQRVIFKGSSSKGSSSKGHLQRVIFKGSSYSVNFSHQSDWKTFFLWN